MSTTTSSSRTSSVQLVDRKPAAESHLVAAERCRSRTSHRSTSVIMKLIVPRYRGQRSRRPGEYGKSALGGATATGLPDAQEWSTTLALAVIQALLGQRPVSQLNRWVVDEVLVAIGMYQRRSLALHGRIAVPRQLRSVRIQHPDPEVAEVSAHVAIGKRSAAMAFRLEALGDRWLCTALELGARIDA